MSADRDIRRLNKLLDVSSTGIADRDVPTWDTNVSSFTMGPSGSGGFDLTVGGNSTSGGAGFGLVSSGTMTLAGGTNITLSQDGNAVTIMGGAGGGTQTFVGGISASNTVYTSGTVNLVATGGGITVGSDVGQKVLLSVAAPVSQTKQTSDLIDLTLDGNTAGVLALMSSGTVTLAGGSNITLSQAGNAVTIVGASAAGATQTAISGIVASNATYTSGTVTFTGVGGGVTVGSNTGQRVDISVAAPVAQTNQSGSVFAISNTFGTSSGTYDARTLSIAGVGAVSVAASNSGWRISAPVQTNQAGSVYASSNTFGTSSGTYDARSISIAGRGAVSVAASNSGWIISAPVQSVQPETQVFVGGISASNTDYTSGTVVFTGVGGGITVSSNTGQRVDLSVAAPVAQTNQSGNVYASSNTFGTSSGTYDARSLSIAGSGAVSVAASNSGWVISAPAQSVQTQSAMNITLGGNSTSAGAGFILLSSGTVTLAGGPNITLSQDGGHVSISAPTPGAASFSVGVSTGGNTAGSTGVTGTRIVFVGADPVTLSQETDANGATISIDVPSLGTISQWPEFPQNAGTGSSLVNTASLYFVTNATTARTTLTSPVFPMVFDKNVTANAMRVLQNISMTSATTTANWSFTNGVSLGIYSMTGDTLSLVSSFSNKQQFSYQSAAASTNASATWSMSYGSGNALSGSQSLSTANAGVTSFWQSVSNVKLFPFAGGTFGVTPGQYWGAWAFSTSTAGANLCSLTALGMYTIGVPSARPVGSNIASVYAPLPLLGQVSMTQTDTAMPVSILTSDISTTATGFAGTMDRIMAITMATLI